MTSIRLRASAAFVLILLVVPACGSGGNPNTGLGRPTQSDGTISDSDISPGQVQLLASEMEREEALDVSSNDKAAVVQADTAFAFDLYARVTKGQGNTFLSPYSIALALSMTYAGARGPTAEQTGRVLHVSLPDEVWHRARNALDRAVTEPEQMANEGFEPLRLQVANSLWGQSSYQFHDTFLDLLAIHYGAGMRLVDYRNDPEGSRAAINGWVEDATKERIRNLIPQGLINDMTRLVLVNAVYFKGNWGLDFNPKRTTRGAFTLLDSSSRQVPMMRIKEKFDYAEGDGWKAARLPYAGGASMVVIAPDKGRFQAIEASLDAGMIERIRSEFEEREVDLAMPRFKFDARFSLAEALKDMGMTDAFEEPPGPSTADFTGITPVRELFLLDVVHKAFVSVDERGTEAAAATGSIFQAVSGAPPATLHLDRAFLFLIQDDETGSILFLGRLTDPSKAE
jgi:serine protease inhibitor